jgi:hypothetical protein
MKHLKKFEDLDYRDLLAQQANLRDQMEKSRLEDIEKRRQELQVNIYLNYHLIMIKKIKWIKI